MIIRIHLPAQYQQLQTIKHVNFPYRTLFQGFMLSIIHLAEQEDLSLFGVFGRIEHALVPYQDFQFPTDATQPVSLDYKEDNDEIIDFYQNSPLTNKKITLLFVRTLLRLADEYGNSIPELIYLIESIPDADNEKKHVSSTNIPVRHETQPTRHSEASDDNVQTDINSMIHVHKATKRPKSKKTNTIDATTMVHVKKPSGQTALQNTATRAHNLAKRLDNMADEAAKAKKIKETPTKSHDVLSRAEQLQQELENGSGKSAEGQTVTTNPLLSSFI